MGKSYRAAIERGDLQDALRDSLREQLRDRRRERAAMADRESARELKSWWADDHA